MGIDRILRLSGGIEAPLDIIACLNWALWSREKARPEEIRAWQSSHEK